MPLLITRAEEDAAATAARLSSAFEAVLAPVIAYVAAGTVEALVASAPSRRCLLVTTPRSVNVALKLVPGREVVALAPRTANELTVAGVAVRAVNGGVEAAMATLDPANTLLLTSDLGAEHAAARWPQLAILVTHRTVAPDSLPAAALQRLTSGAPYAVFFASPSAVENFEAFAPGALARAAKTYFHGESTRRALEARGVSPLPLPLGA